MSACVLLEAKNTYNIKTTNGNFCECPEKPYVLLQNMKYPKRTKKLLCRSCYKIFVNSAEAKDHKVVKFFG